MRTLLSIGLMASLVWSFPQDAEIFNDFSQRSQTAGFANDFDVDVEVLPYQVLESFEDYSVVMFPASKWICTTETINNGDDPFDGWRERFRGDGRAAMENSEDLDKANKMFQRLFRYIIGVNSESKVIPMTKPVVDHRVNLPGDRTKHELCFWSGTKYTTTELPEPTDEEVYFVPMQAQVVFIKRFGGYALSSEDWIAEKNELMELIKDRPDVDLDAGFFSVGFDGPTKTEGRRNEIWIPKLKGVDYSGINQEVLGHTVIKTFPSGIELREYPATTWACTKREHVSPSHDTMNGWQETFKNNPYEALSSPQWQQSHFKQLSDVLKKYAMGVNTDFTDIGLKMPIKVLHEPKDVSEGFIDVMEAQSVCVWLGKDYNTKEPPRPVDNSIFFFKKSPSRMYAKDFGGYPLSSADYYELHDEFEANMVEDGLTAAENKWMHAIYNSYYQGNGRRNEIIVEAA